MLFFDNCTSLGSNWNNFANQSKMQTILKKTTFTGNSISRQYGNANRVTSVSYKTQVADSNYKLEISQSTPCANFSSYQQPTNTYKIQKLIIIHVKKGRTVCTFNPSFIMKPFLGWLPDTRQSIKLRKYLIKLK